MSIEITVPPLPESVSDAILVAWHKKEGDAAAKYDADKTRRIVFCSGKVYYDLVEARQLHGVSDVAIVRIEQIYQFPVEQFSKIISDYPNAPSDNVLNEEPVAPQDVGVFVEHVV